MDRMAGASPPGMARPPRGAAWGRHGRPARLEEDGFRDCEPTRGCPYRRCAEYLMQYEVIVIDEQRRHGFHRR